VLENKYFEIATSVGVTVVLLSLRSLVRAIVKKHAHKYDLDISQRTYANKFFNFVFIVLLFVVMGIIWDVSVKGLSIYFASFFTIVGVALFATWSILSNITASIILFFNSPLKIGTTIAIIDKEHGVTGVVQDISFFSIQILTPEGDMVSYPNNIAIQKPIKSFK
jgi:MscS family membrane protein